MSEAKKVDKTPNEKLNEFLRGEGLTLVTQPNFVSTNHGTFEVKVTVNAVSVKK